MVPATDSLLFTIKCKKCGNYRIISGSHNFNIGTDIRCSNCNNLLPKDSSRWNRGVPDFLGDKTPVTQHSMNGFQPPQTGELSSIEIKVGENLHIQLRRKYNIDKLGMDLLIRLFCADAINLEFTPKSLEKLNKQIMDLSSLPDILEEIAKFIRKSMK